jgi:ribonuclease Z
MSRSCTLCLLGLLLLAPPPAFAQKQAQTLKVTLLGTGVPRPDITRFGPATLVEAAGQRLVFDAGRGVSQRLAQLKIPLGQVDALFLTHLHSDHVVGVADLWLFSWLPTPFGSRTKPLEVWGPAGTTAMMAALREAYAWDLRVRIGDDAKTAHAATVVTHEIAQGVVYEKDGVKVTAFTVDHGEHLQPALGYRVDYAGRSVVLSGDTRPSENLIRFAKGADVVIHEVFAAPKGLLERSAVARGIGGYHTTPEQAGRVFARVRPKLAVYSHLALFTLDASVPPPRAESLIPLTRATYAGPLVVGEDLMTLDIGEQVAVHRFTPRP